MLLTETVLSNLDRSGVFGLEFICAGGKGEKTGRNSDKLLNDGNESFEIGFELIRFEKFVLIVKG